MTSDDLTPTAPPTLDYRALLTKYMAHVWDEEGDAFIPYIEADTDFSEAECAELATIAAEVSGQQVKL